VAAVWLLHHLVARRFGAGAGLLAALFLAITPISVAVDRATIPDACLVLVLLLASWALLRAPARRSRREAPTRPVCSAASRASSALRATTGAAGGRRIRPRNQSPGEV